MIAQDDILNRLSALRAKYAGAALIEPVLADASAEIVRLRRELAIAVAGLDATEEFIAGMDLARAMTKAERAAQCVQ